MQIHKKIRIDVILVAAFLLFQGCEKMQNTPPKILSLSVTDENVALGEKDQNCLISGTRHTKYS
jgi:hypothetical protein